MLRQRVNRLLSLLVLLLFTGSMQVLALTPSEDKENKDLFRRFVYLLNYGQEEEFYAQAALYGDFLKAHGMKEEYYKIKTNEGFFDVNHAHPFRAMNTCDQLDREIREAGDTAYCYLATGLKADIYKLTYHFKADSTYRQALVEVGDRDPKFKMLVHMSLAQVNYMSQPQDAMAWADLALSEASQLGNYEFRSMALGMKGYLNFMMGNKEGFDEVELQFNNLKAEFDSLEAKGETLGRQRFCHMYDAVLRIARLSFDGHFSEAIDLARTEQLNVERQQVIFRIHSLDGMLQKEKSHRNLIWGFSAMTVLYVFVYIMGRRRLIRKIWQRNREIEDALKKADAGIRMKAAFIRSMSHEIRTPLNAINGFSQILCSSDYDLSEEEKTNIKERITSNSEAITIIINELLELAAGETATFTADNLRDVWINDVCRKALTALEKHNRKRLMLSFNTELDDTFTIKSNAETVGRILEKILENAMKFTDEGGVTVNVSKTDKDVLVSITDTGKGIPAEKQEAIFENFVKLNDYKGGVGLGLPICRQLAYALGGNIYIDPSYKKGSRFVVQLPLHFS